MDPMRELLGQGGPAAAPPMAPPGPAEMAPQLPPDMAGPAAMPEAMPAPTPTPPGVPEGAPEGMPPQMPEGAPGEELAEPVSDTDDFDDRPTPEEVEYAWGDCCATCEHYMPPEGCGEVNGHIRPDGYCVLYNERAGLPPAATGDQ